MIGYPVTLVNWSAARTDLVLFILCAILVGVSNPKFCVADDSALKSLEAVLLSEVAGKPLDRQQSLAGLIGDSPSGVELLGGTSQAKDAAALRWQSGYYLSGGEWRGVKDLQKLSDSNALTAYEKQRGDGILGIESHRRLARWCRSQGELEKAKAHWFGVLEVQPSDPEARKELGYVFEFGRWISVNEMALATAKAKRVSEDLKEWMPKVKEWVGTIEGTDTKKRLRAVNQLKEVKDPGVIVPLEIAINQVSEDTALHFVRTIQRFQTREACLSLAGIAIAYPSTEIGSTAMEALREFPKEFYVPDLLDLMCTEIELKNQVVTRANGELILQLVQMRELRDKFERNQLDKVMIVGKKGSGKSQNGLAVERVGGGWMVFRAYRTSKGAVLNEVASSIAEKEAQRDAESVNAGVQRANEAIRKLQSDIGTVLRGTTLVNLRDDPRMWWEWWDRYCESYSVGEKEVESRYLEDRSSVALAPKRVQASDDYSVLLPRRLDCLVLGTLIVTESGLRPIERIRVGDLVLTQDVESGQIALKPVLRTTIRPAASTKEFRLSSGEIVRSTMGHQWWVIGQGWFKTKDLKEGMALRTSSGFATILSLKDAGEIETYNLVVDEYHTYFVGQSGVLAYDATELIPTFQKTLGLPAPVLR